MYKPVILDILRRRYPDWITQEIYDKCVFTMQPYVLIPEIIIKVVHDI